MNIIKNKIVLFVVLSCICVGSFLYLTLRKSTILSVEGKFGTFCLTCKAIESGSAIGVHGFGLAYCNGKIKEMSNKVNYDEIESFKLYLKEKELLQILNKVLIVENSLKSNNTEKYFFAIQDYTNEIMLLDEFEKQKVLSYFKE